MSYYNPNIPLETALEMIEDPHMRHELIEDYHYGLSLEKLPEPADLLSTFARSEYGKDLESKSRFGVFKPDWVTTEQWTGLLGPDVNNLYHMPHTYDLAKAFCEGENLDAPTTQVLLTTAITHDWGEALIGDIALPNKTEEDEKREKVAYRQIATELLGERGNALTDLVWSVLEKTDPVRGEMFRAIEYIGYCTTALRARHEADLLVHGVKTLDITRDQKDQLTGALLGLHKAVEAKNFPTLAEYAKKFPSISEQARYLNGD